MKSLKKGIMIVLTMILIGGSGIAEAHDWGKTALIIYGADQLFNGGRVTRSIMDDAGQIVNLPSDMIHNYSGSVNYVEPQETYTRQRITYVPQNYYPAEKATITIVNATRRNVRLVANGQDLGALSPGQVKSIETNQQVSIAAIAICRKGNITAASRTYNPQPSRSYIWIIRPRNLY